MVENLEYRDKFKETLNSIETLVITRFYDKLRDTCSYILNYSEKNGIYLMSSVMKTYYYKLDPKMYMHLFRNEVHDFSVNIQLLRFSQDIDNITYNCLFLGHKEHGQKEFLRELKFSTKDWCSYHRHLKSNCSCIVKINTLYSNIQLIKKFINNMPFSKDIIMYILTFFPNKYSDIYRIKTQCDLCNLDASYKKKNENKWLCEYHAVSFNYEEL